MTNIPFEFRCIPTTVKEILSLCNTNAISTLKKAKVKVCLMCHQLLNNNNSKLINMPNLPCNCQICSFNCLDTYLKLIFTKQANTQNYCICGYIFNYNDYQYLFQYFEGLKMKEYKNLILKVVYKSYIRCCLLCLKEYYNSKNNFLSLKLKDQRILDVYKIKEIKHLICEDCYLDSQKFLKE